MLNIEENVDRDIKISASVLAKYVKTNRQVVIKEGNKNSCRKLADGNWEIKSNGDEDFLIRTFRKIYRARYGSSRFFNLRLENYYEDKAAISSYFIF